jgi:phage shock protein C
MTQMPSYRQLRRSQADRKISGVCGGLGEYFNLDPTIVRIAAVALTVFTGGGFIIAYVLAMLIMPDQQPETPVWNYPPPAPGYTPPTPPVQD